MKYSKETVELALLVLRETIEESGEYPAALVIAENERLRKRAEQAEEERDKYLCDCQDYHKTVQGLESENAELREKLAVAEKSNHDLPGDTECPHCGFGYMLPSGRCDHCNLRKNEPGYQTEDDDGPRCETCDDTGKVETCAEYVFPGTPDKPCPDCRPKPSQGQWAVTSVKLVGESEARLIAKLLNCHPDTANDYRAVPLSPAADGDGGPWVLFRDFSQHGIPCFYVDAIESRSEPKDARRFESMKEAKDYCKAVGGFLLPVRLSDVQG